MLVGGGASRGLFLVLNQHPTSKIQHPSFASVSAHGGAEERNPRSTARCASSPEPCHNSARDAHNVWPALRAPARGTDSWPPPDRYKQPAPTRTAPAFFPACRFPIAS